MSVDADLFRAVARSSPMLWRTVRLRWRSWERRETPGAWERAWIRRPGDLRVESPSAVSTERQGGPDMQLGDWVVEDDGLGDVTYRKGAGSGRSAMVTTGGRIGEDEVREYVAQRRRDSAPVLRPDGLAESLPGRSWGMDTVPFHTNYRWVAMLEPTELADGADPDDHIPAQHPALAVHSVRQVDHHGRPALEAEVTPLSTYNPRCGCCPLLDGAEAYRIESAGYGGPLPGFEDSGAPDATRFRVRLDRATGICVAAEALDGDGPAMSHSAIIEEVDVPYPDSVFTPG